jgi:ribosome maturation factor RimP
MGSRKSMSAGPEPVRQALTPEIEAELAEIAAAAGCELIHVEWKGGVLRLVLDRQTDQASPAAVESSPDSDDSAGASAAGVSLGDCEHVAKQASALLDVLDFGRGRYLLEVSSPGLDRQLYGPRDFQRFLGRLARVSYEAAGKRRTVVARLAEFHPPAPAGPRATLATPARPALPELPAPPPVAPRALPPFGEVTLIDERTGERLTLAVENIRLARLEVEL